MQYSHIIFGDWPSCVFLWSNQSPFEKTLNTTCLKEQVHPLMVIVVTTRKRCASIMFMCHLESYLSYFCYSSNQDMKLDLLGFNTKNAADITNQLWCVNSVDKDTAVTMCIHIISSHIKRISHEGKPP